MGIKALYNPTTNQITGCEPGTIEYFHEEGHSLHRNGLRFFFGVLWLLILFIISLMSIGLVYPSTSEINFIFALFTTFLIASYIIYEEMFAWGYALKKWWWKNW